METRSSLTSRHSRTVAKRALLYALVVGAVGALFLCVEFSNQRLVSAIPGVPVWLFPLFLSGVLVSIGAFVWREHKKKDALKYSFIPIITHKFRTPMTHIKWATEGLIPSVTETEPKRELLEIRTSVDAMINLTNLLLALSDSESAFAQYNDKRVSFGSFVEEIVLRNAPSATHKNKTLRFSGEREVGDALIDTEKVSFVVQALIKNALTYTLVGGVIKVAVRREGVSVLCEVSDNGIGIPRDDIPRVFGKFFRAKNAKETETDGLGIDLYMASLVIARYGGTLSAVSAGVGKGSTFTLSLPRVA
ncbi:MAG: HAMP domain-containing sensor histidine kinase [bacterium]|nr:HAMP domain-containing sensor histidine kinase [bacterium]